jgi:hypothetical protein
VQVYALDGKTCSDSAICTARLKAGETWQAIFGAFIGNTGSLGLAEHARFPSRK